MKKNENNAGMIRIFKKPFIWNTEIQVHLETINGYKTYSKKQ